MGMMCIESQRGGNATYDAFTGSGWMKVLNVDRISDFSFAYGLSATRMKVESP